MTGSTQSLEQRLDRLESRIAIEELIHTYARCIRYDRPDEVGALFTEDGTFEVRDGHPDKTEFVSRSVLVGRASVHAQMAHNKGNAHPVPLIHNLIVELAGNHATATCVMEGKIYSTDHSVTGEYRDTFRREQGKWLFAARIYTIFTAASSL